MRILVVDDEEMQRELLSGFLKKKGFDVITAKDGKEVLSLIRRIAPTEWTALIRGETGTGKELIARLIHLLSPRSSESFIEVNCAAIPENLFESELFGHEKGAFTGAASMKKGRFELAQNGTVFLDEVGELPLNLQAKMLRALQEKKINRVGSEKEIELDVRIITATNRDIKKMAEEKLFREDLYYRLNALEIEIPPLRKRKKDIPALIDFFLHKFNSGSVSFSYDAMTTLMKYSFPGNIRELEHMIQRVITLSRSLVIQVRDLPQEVKFYQSANQGNLADRLIKVEKEMIITALEKNRHIQTRAAESLGISERVLRYKMKKHMIQK